LNLKNKSIKNSLKKKKKKNRRFKKLESRRRVKKSKRIRNPRIIPKHKSQFLKTMNMLQG